MKKLMIVAAAAAMTFVGSAALKPTVCENCGVGEGPQDCDTVVFKVTGSGKAVSDKGDYKTVESLKIKKGALALIGELCEANGLCCYNEGYLFATIKVGKKSFELEAPVTLGVWSIFGKNLDKARNYMTAIKPGKKVTLESALFVVADEAETDGEDYVDLSEFALWASAFGKAELAVTSKKVNDSYCTKSEQGCDPVYTIKDYKGWFVGTYPCVGEEDCFLCDCADTDVYGGTWSAKFQKKVTTLSGAAKLGGVSLSSDDE